MPRTREELERAAAAAEAWLDGLDPNHDPAEDPDDLRRIGLALRSLAAEQRELEDAVAAARHNGRSWGEIGLVLGTSRQAARERYGLSAQPQQAPSATSRFSFDDKPKARAGRFGRRATVRLGAADAVLWIEPFVMGPTEDHRGMYHIVGADSGETERK